MSCNIIEDKRVDLKTSLPANSGSFWLTEASDSAKRMVRALTRLNTQGNAYQATDYFQNLMGNSTSHINCLPTYFKIKPEEAGIANFDISNFIATSGNGISDTETIPLRKLDYCRFGIYGLDDETYRIWSDDNGVHWLFPVTFNPELVSNPFGNDYDTNKNSIYFYQPAYTVPYSTKVPTLIMGKDAYLVIGVDFEIVNGSLHFFRPIEELFDERVFIISGYENKESLMGFPFSVDRSVGNTDYISKFLRQNNSIKKLEDALNQVTGFTPVAKDGRITFTTNIPDGTVVVFDDFTTQTQRQPDVKLGYVTKGEFIGGAVRLIAGNDPEALSVARTKGITFSTYLGKLYLDEGYYLATNDSGFVSIDLVDPDISTYLNTTRRYFEDIVRYDINGEVATTFSQYLLDTYAGLEDNPVMVDIVGEFFNFFGDNIILVEIADNIDQAQKDAVYDFLQTHTHTNVIIFFTDHGNNPYI